jgi:hypothetical protein
LYYKWEIDNPFDHLIINFANRKLRLAALLYIFWEESVFSMMFTVSECDLISNTLTSHDSAHIRGRPTLKDAE